MQSHRMYTRHHYLDYALTPNYQEGLTRHNSFGFRGPEISLRKPTGTYRIAVLGGSTTYTISVKDNAKTFTARLQRILSDHFPKRHIEVIDAGVPDYTSWESLINLEFRVLDFDPDLVVVYHGVNDVQARLVEPSHYKGDNSGLRKQWSIPPIKWWEHSVILRILSRNLGLTRQPGLIDVIDEDTSLGAERPRSEGVRFDPAEADRLLPTLNSNPAVFFRRNLVSMIGVARAHAIKIMLATWAYCPCRNDYASTALYQTGFEQNNEVVRGVAGSFHVPMLDFVKLMPREKRYWHDGRHLNEQGALIKAKIFADFIGKRFLAKGLASSW